MSPWPDLWERLRVALLLRSKSGVSLDGAAMAASLVPGLGHILTGDRRTGLLFLSAWLLLVLSWFVFMPITTGNAAIGVAVGVHVAAMAGAGGVPRVHRGGRARLAVILSLLLILGSLYLLPVRLLQRIFTFVRPTYAVPALDVRQGDTLWTTRLGVDGEWHAIELCVIRFSSDRHYHWGYPHIVPRGPYLALRVAGPGDRIAVRPDGIHCNDRPIVSSEQLDAMGIALPRQPLMVMIPERHSMALFPLGPTRIAQEHTQTALETIYSEVYVAPRHAIVGRVRSVYLPFRRRHRLAYENANFLKEPVD